MLALLAAGPTVAGFGLYNMSLACLPSGIVNLIATLEPPFTAAIAYVLLGERLTLLQAAGGALVVAGVAGLRVWEGWLAGRTGRSCRVPPMRRPSNELRRSARQMNTGMPAGAGIPVSGTTR